MKALLTDACRFTVQQLEQIKALGYETFTCSDEATCLSETCYGCDAIVCNRLLLFQPPERFHQAGLIQLTSSGLNNVPINKLSGRTLTLCNARGVYSVPIAEWVVLKILEIYKSTRFFEQAQRYAQWKKSREVLELAGKTIGIIGTGSIGTEVAKRLKAFDCSLLGLNSTGSDHPLFDSVHTTASLNTFLRRCDVVVLTVPMNLHTQNLLNKSTLPHMKHDAVLINVSRGGIVNEVDLLQHMNNGFLQGAALDVFGQEPLPPENPLWKHPRVLVTPHNSFVSDNINGRLFKLIFGNLKAFLQGEPVQNKVEV